MHRHGKIATAREVRKIKEKWEGKPKDLDLLKEYIYAINSRREFELIESLLTKELETRNKQKSFMKWTMISLNILFENVSEEFSILIVDSYIMLYKHMEIVKFMTSNDFERNFVAFVRGRVPGGIDAVVKSTEKEVENILSKHEEAKSHKPTPREEIIVNSITNNTELNLELYEVFNKNKSDEWKNDKEIEKGLFRIAMKLRKHDEGKAQELLDFCMESSPENKKYINYNKRWNTKAEVDKKKIVETKPSEEKISTKTIITSLENQIFTHKDFFETSPKIKDLFSGDYLQKIIDNDITKFRKDRKWGSVLISLANIFLNELSKVEDAFAIYEIIDNMRLDNKLREKEIKQANHLMYDILVAQEKYDEAKIWDDKNGLGVDSEVKINQDKKIEEISELEATSADAGFYELIRAESIKYYRKRVDFYINNGQFKHKLGEEVSDIVINNLKDKIAIDLKYLDFEIRELILPYFIKIEGNAKTVLGRQRDVIGSAIDRAFGNYTKDMRFLIDVTKLNETVLGEQELFGQFILAYRAIRNHMAHGNLNLFGLKLHTTRKSSTTTIDYEESVSLFELTGDDFLNKIISNAKMKTGVLDIFRLDIAEKVLSFDAVDNKRGFGIALIILYMTMPSYTFLRVASEIDHKINTFRNRTVFGSKNKLYESLGLKPDWLINLLEKTEKEE